MAAKVCVASVAVFALLSSVVLSQDLAEVCSREKDGNLVIQAEDTTLTSDWRFGNSIEGFTGRGYISWFGENEYQFEGKGMLKYKVCVTGGTYKINIWSMRLDKPGLRDDEGNDAWMKVGDEWIKLFTAFGSKMNIWKLSMLFDVNDEKEEPLIRLEAGCQYFEVAARSEMYSLDRFMLVKVGSDLDMDMGVMNCDGSDSNDGSNDGNVIDDGGNNDGNNSGDDDNTIDVGPMQPPKCAMMRAPELPDRSVRVLVTFTNKKGYPVFIYKRTQKGELIYLQEMDSMATGQTITVKAFKYDMFAAAKADGTCLRNKMTIGITGRMKDNATKYTLA